MGNIKNLYLFWLARRLPTCKDILPDISRAMDERLSLRRWIVLKLHLHICEMCLRYEKQLQLIREAVQKEPETRGLSADAREHIKRALQK